MINKSIAKLISYGLLTGLIHENDTIYVLNRILTKLGLDSYEETSERCEPVDELSKILKLHLLRYQMQFLFVYVAECKL